VKDVVIEGTFVLEGHGGVELTGPQTGRLRWTTTDDGQSNISFLSGHQFHLPDGAAQAVWLRFDDGDGRTLLRQPMGVQSVVTVRPSP
jgi:hypothetical protein